MEFDTMSDGQDERCGTIIIASDSTWYHSVNSSSHSVNGDIAIQWEWSNLDPSQNTNP